MVVMDWQSLLVAGDAYRSSCCTQPCEVSLTTSSFLTFQNVPHTYLRKRRTRCGLENAAIIIVQSFFFGLRMGSSMRRAHRAARVEALVRARLAAFYPQADGAPSCFARLSSGSALDVPCEQYCCRSSWHELNPFSWLSSTSPYLPVTRRVAKTVVGCAIVLCSPYCHVLYTVG